MFPGNAETSLPPVQLNPCLAINCFAEALGDLKRDDFDAVATEFLNIKHDHVAYKNLSMGLSSPSAKSHFQA